MTDYTQTILNKIGSIPLFQSESAKRGDYSALNKTSSIHYLIYPLLQAVGYDVFNPEKVKIGEILPEGVLDMAAYENNQRILGIVVADYKDTPNPQALADFYLRGHARNHAAWNVPITMVTNGILYAIYTGDKYVAAFDITQIGEGRTEFIFKLITKDSLVSIHTNPHFLDEALIESQYKNLRKSEYLQNTLRGVLEKPQDVLLQAITDAMYAQFCSVLDKNELQKELKDEILANPGCLLDMLGKGAPQVQTQVFTQPTAPYQTQMTTPTPMQAAIVENVQPQEVYTPTPAPVIEPVAEHPRFENEVEIKTEEIVEEDKTVDDYTSLESLLDDDDADGASLGSLLF